MNCPLCGEAGCTLGVTRVESVWPTPYDVAYCPHCVGYFLETWPTAEEMRRFYVEEYHDYSPLIFLLKRMFRYFRSASQVAFMKEHYPLRDRSILEVGAADGMLVKLLAPDNDVYGTEFNQRMRDFAMRKYNIDLHPKDLFELDDRYDLIIMSQVLEHFTDISAVMDQLKVLLKPRGSVFVELPNSPPFGQWPIEVIKDYVRTPHIYNFSPTSLTRLFERNGFEVIAKKRFTYRLPHALPEKYKLRLRRAFLVGGGVTPALAMPALWYAASSLWNPAASFEAIPIEAPWKGVADDIRIIAQRRQ